MHFKRALLAAALTAGLGLSTFVAADAAVTATINIVNNNASTTIYHGTGTYADSFVGVSGWSVAPPSSLLAGNSDYSAKIVLGANQSVGFNFGSISFANYCAFTVSANQSGSGFLAPRASPNVMGTGCTITAQSGHPYNFEATVSGF